MYYIYILCLSRHAHNVAGLAFHTHTSPSHPGQAGSFGFALAALVWGLLGLWVNWADIVMMVVMCF